MRPWTSVVRRRRRKIRCWLRATMASGCEMMTGSPLVGWAHACPQFTSSRSRIVGEGSELFIHLARWWSQSGQQGWIIRLYPLLLWLALELRCPRAYIPERWRFPPLLTASNLLVGFLWNATILYFIEPVLRRGGVRCMGFGLGERGCELDCVSWMMSTHCGQSDPGSLS